MVVLTFEKTKHTEKTANLKLNHDFVVAKEAEKWCFAQVHLFSLSQILLSCCTVSTPHPAGASHLQSGDNLCASSCVCPSRPGESSSLFLPLAFRITALRAGMTRACLGAWRLPQIKRRVLSPC